MASKLPHEYKNIPNNNLREKACKMGQNEAGEKNRDTGYHVCDPYS